MQVAERTFRLLLACCFTIGSVNHARDILAGGMLPYHAVPVAINAFWTALCPIDAIVALLAWRRATPGIVLGIGVLAADVGVNSWIAYCSGLQVRSFEPLQVQTLVLGFAIGGGLFSLLPRKPPKPAQAPPRR